MLILKSSCIVDMIGEQGISKHEVGYESIVCSSCLSQIMSLHNKVAYYHCILDILTSRILYCTL